jgi:hypothetical protein
MKGGERSEQEGWKILRGVTAGKFPIIDLFSNPF